MGGCCCRSQTVKIHKVIPVDSDIKYKKDTKDTSYTRQPDIQSFQKIDKKEINNENKKEKEKEEKKEEKEKQKVKVKEKEKEKEEGKEKEKEKEKENSIALDNLKTDIDETKDKSIILHISSQNENFLNIINKKKIVKKGSDRIHEAMNELKLLTLNDINKNQKFFKLKN